MPNSFNQKFETQVKFAHRLSNGMWIFFCVLIVVVFGEGAILLGLVQEMRDLKSRVSVNEAKQLDLENSLIIPEADLRALEEHVYKIHPRPTGYVRPGWAPPIGRAPTGDLPQRTTEERSVLKGGPRTP